MKIHILGICGTFMGGLALIARQLGHSISGSDQNVYPPMSDVLRAAGVEIQDSYDISHFRTPPDLVIVGNTITRGNLALEYVLNKNIRYISGPQWLYEQVLCNRHVIAVSGTHGKTTTTSLLAWILTHAGRNPGYLIGGVAKNFEHTADLGKEPLFVIEADEYDSAFYDKRSKFIHYRPRTLVINNLEYDHADIFPDLEAIKKQFQSLLRVVPSSGTVIYSANDENIMDVLKRGCWAQKHSVGGSEGIWKAKNQNAEGSRFELWHRDQRLGTVNWKMIGEHNVQNAVIAAAAAHDVGIMSSEIISGLNSFSGVKRRLEVRGNVNDIIVYDDFAHHPTAITATIAALRSRVGERARIVAVVQFGSNSMRQGVYDIKTLALALRGADRVDLLKPELWDSTLLLQQLGNKAHSHNDVQSIIDGLSSELRQNDHVLIMSNKGFDGIHQRLLDSIQAK
jgi:UDP-N-acetylmuramate: L-alanyl-gamma-D-glutamyl-meso-diaminopimelate ligase